MSWRGCGSGVGATAPSVAEAAVACHAPFTSMYLDQRGWVRACCMNDFHTLGNIGTEPLSAIWRGDRVGELRRAMERSDLTLGCDISAGGRSRMAIPSWPSPAGSPSCRWANPIRLAPPARAA